MQRPSSQSTQTDQQPIVHELWILRLAQLSLVLLLAALACYAANGLFFRYLADDYETAALLKEVGFFSSQRYWYMHWSGRFSFYLLVNLAEWVGLKIVPLLPGLVLCIWLAGLTWSLLAVMRQAQVRRPRFAAFFLAALVGFGVLRQTPSLVQSFYWQTGLLTYLAPLAMISFLPGMVMHFSRRGGIPAWSTTACASLAACALLAGAATGFSETSAAMQTAAFGMALALAAFQHSGSGWRRALPWITAGLAGSLAGMALVAFAPGNAVRMANYQRCGILQITQRTLAESWRFTAPGWRDLPQIVLLLLLPALLAVWLARRCNGRQKLWPLALLPVSAFLLVNASVVPAFFAMCSGPPDRVSIVPQFALTGLMAAWGWFAGSALTGEAFLKGTFLQTAPVRWLHARSKLVFFGTAALVLALLAAGPVYAGYRSILRGAGLSTYAAQWDLRHETIIKAQQAGQRSIIVPEIKLGLDKDLGDLRAEPDFWINRAAARYYGLDEIRAVEAVDGTP